MDEQAQVDIQKAFGSRLRELRRWRGLTQEVLAAESDIDRSYIGQVERGERNIALINIHKIAKGLGVEPYELLLPEDHKNETEE